MRHSPRESARSGRCKATLAVSVRNARRSSGSSLPLNDNRARTSDVNPIIFSRHSRQINNDRECALDDCQWITAWRSRNHSSIRVSRVFISLHTGIDVENRIHAGRVCYCGGLHLRNFTPMLRNRKVEPVSRTERDSLLSYRLAFAGRSWLVCRL